MLKELENKRGVFLDMGWTLEQPASGDWMVTNKFRSVVGEVKMSAVSQKVVQAAEKNAFAYLAARHQVNTIDEEIAQFTVYYGLLAENCGFTISAAQCRELAVDRTLNMDNYHFFDDAAEAVKILAQSHQIGIISDAWPDALVQLGACGFSRYISSVTISSYVGVFKPDKRMFEDALLHSRLKAEECVFVDDLAKNLASAASLGITSIQMLADPNAVPDGRFVQIHRISQLVN